MNTKSIYGKTTRKRNKLAQDLYEDPRYRPHYINKTKRNLVEEEAERELKEYYANQKT